MQVHLNVVRRKFSIVAKAKKYIYEPDVRKGFVKRLVQMFICFF